MKNERGVVVTGVLLFMMACMEATETTALETVTSRCCTRTAIIVICMTALRARIQCLRKTRENKVMDTNQGNTNNLRRRIV